MSQAADPPESDRFGERLSDVAYRAILAALFDRRVSAGAFVSQTDLVALTGCPVGPLRDALRVLEADGVLTIHPRSGIQFVRPGADLTRETYQFRGLIERAGVRLLAETADAATLDRIEAAHRALLDDLPRLAVVDLPRRANELEALLHGAVVSVLDNRQIDAAYRRLALMLRIIRLDAVWSARSTATSLAEHLEILAALRARDPDAAEDALRRHLGSALQRHLRIL